MGIKTMFTSEGCMSQSYKHNFTPENLLVQTFKRGGGGNSWVGGIRHTFGTLICTILSNMKDYITLLLMKIIIAIIQGSCVPFSLGRQIACSLLIQTALTKRGIKFIITNYNINQNLPVVNRPKNAIFVTMNAEYLNHLKTNTSHG